MENPRRRGPYAKTAERRAQIGRAAMEIVHEFGHAAVTAEAVARRAAVTTATVNYHFPTRDDLLVAALDAREDILYADGAAAEASLSVADMLSDVVRDRSSSRRYVALYAAMSAAAADPEHPAHEWIRTHLCEARSRFALTVSALQERGEAHPDVDPQQFGREMVAVWDGLQVQWLTEGDFDLGDAVADAFRTLARMDTMEARRALEALAAEL